MIKKWCFHDKGGPRPAASVPRHWHTNWVRIFLGMLPASPSLPGEVREGEKNSERERDKKHIWIHQAEGQKKWKQRKEKKSVICNKTHTGKHKRTSSIHTIIPRWPTNSRIFVSRPNSNVTTMAFPWSCLRVSEPSARLFWVWWEITRAGETVTVCTPVAKYFKVSWRPCEHVFEMMCQPIPPLFHFHW